MITALPPARRDSHHACLRRALDRIDELLDPADLRRGLGAVLALLLPQARGRSAQARLALAGRCVAQRIRQEATDDLLAAAAPFVGRALSDAERDTLERRLRRKTRELRLLTELRLPGRLARADEGLAALAASSHLSDPLRGFILTTTSQYRILDAGLIARLEALSPLLASPRSPLGTLTAKCMQLGTSDAQNGGDGPAALFNAFAAAHDDLVATRARLGHGRSEQQARTLAALEHPSGLLDLAILSIGSTAPGTGQRHTRLCHRIAQTLAGRYGQAVTRALAERTLAGGTGHAMLEALMGAWSVIAHQAAFMTQRSQLVTVSVPPEPVPACLARTVTDYFNET